MSDTIDALTGRLVAVAHRAPAVVLVVLSLAKTETSHPHRDLVSKRESKSEARDVRVQSEEQRRYVRHEQSDRAYAWMPEDPVQNGGPIVRCVSLGRTVRTLP